MNTLDIEYVPVNNLIRLHSNQNSLKKKYRNGKVDCHIIVKTLNIGYVLVNMSYSSSEFFEEEVSEWEGRE